MADQEVPGHFTHGELYSPFYEGDYGIDDLPFFFVGMPITQRAISQRDPLGNTIQGLKPLHTCEGIY